MANKIGPVDQSMIGKIGNKLEETASTRGVSPDKDLKTGAAARPDARDDTVELTSAAQLLERLEKSLESLPAIDSQRVDEIRSAIENGDYQIDADAIADAMIRLERSFGE